MYLGIDLGTSGVKVLLLASDHRVVATAQAPLTVAQPQPHWSEQDPQQWWQATQQAMQQLRAQAAPALARVRAIGLSGQMHGAVVLDAAQQVLRPAILWNDGRASAECRQLLEREPRLTQLTGNLAMPGFTAPKLLWLQTHEPALFAKIRHVLLPKDWLRLQMTGEFASDLSDASGTLWVDVAQRCYSDAMLQACDLTQAQLPRLFEGSTFTAQLQDRIADDWGVPRATPVAAGAGDNAASAVGVGAVAAGQGFVSLGTSGVIFSVGAAYQAAPELGVHAFAHALPGRWHQMSVMLTAASASPPAPRIGAAIDRSPR